MNAQKSGTDRTHNMNRWQQLIKHWATNFANFSLFDSSQAEES